MVKMIYNGDNETFFHYKGIKYQTTDYEVDVPKEVSEWLKSNPRWETVRKITKTKEE